MHENFLFLNIVRVRQRSYLFLNIVRVCQRSYHTPYALFLLLLMRKELSFYSIEPSNNAAIWISSSAFFRRYIALKEGDLKTCVFITSLYA